MVREKFPAYKIIDRDQSEGFDRPACFITVDDMNDDTIGLLCRDENSIALNFFAKKREAGFLELLDLRNKLRETLSQPLTISEFFHLAFDNVHYHFSKADMSLETRFTILTVQSQVDKDYEGLPDMLDLDFNLLEKGVKN